MQQLSGLDNASLFTERCNVYNHVGTLLVYDVSAAPGGSVRYKDILRHFEERLHLHPVFSNHLARVPLGIDRPYYACRVVGDRLEFSLYGGDVVVWPPGPAPQRRRGRTRRKS